MRILVAGRLASPPRQGGATWAVLQYTLGLSELGHDVMTVDPGGSGLRDATTSRYFESILGRWKLSTSAALICGSGQTMGVPYPELVSWASGADLLVNLAGCLTDPNLVGAPSRRLYVDLDPAFTQTWQSSEGIDMGLSNHDAFATVGQLLGREECEVPTCGVEWLHTLPPVVLSQWPADHSPPSRGITTVANWRSYGSVDFAGTVLGQKAHSFRALIDLPDLLRRERFEPAISIHPGDGRDIDALSSSGWLLLDPAETTGDSDAFRDFVRSSTAEIGTAKSGYVRSRCGWFSDRSAAYLASGRPVVAQDTGWPEILPAGQGLLCFSTSSEAAFALEEAVGDYPRHCEAARMLACDLFDSHKVLPRLLSLAGV